MERFTISFDDELTHQFDELIAGKGYGNRSEAAYDLIAPAWAAQRSTSLPNVRPLGARRT